MIRLRTVSAAAVLLLGVVAAGYPPTARPQPERSDCQRTTVTVNLSPQDATRYRVVGWLCDKGRSAGRTVQLLVSGLTYDHTYWDLPYKPDTYSYVRAALNSGYATFNIDRIGVGESDRPPADQVTVISEAYTTHQIIQALRLGRIGGTHFQKVIGVGHSMGSAILMYEAATYSDVDGLILANYLHKPNVAQVAAIGATLYPAQDDPRFAAAGVPAGYVTTKPGTRAGNFYYSGYADPQVVATDEAFKQTATPGERATMNVSRDPKISLAITVPVLVLVGQRDSLLCTSDAGMSCASVSDVMAREQPYYGPKACLVVMVLPSSGHDTNLHLNARQWFISAALWSSRRVGPGPLYRTGQNCR